MKATVQSREACPTCGGPVASRPDGRVVGCCPVAMSPKPHDALRSAAGSWSRVIERGVYGFTSVTAPMPRMALWFSLLVLLALAFLAALRWSV